METAPVDSTAGVFYFNNPIFGKFVTLIKLNVTMSNSFYYFFSATPQVLGGILALFGVFVIFKIQTIKTQLLGVGQSFFDSWEFLITKQRNYFKYTSENIDAILGDVKKSIQINDIENLKKNIDLVQTKILTIRTAMQSNLKEDTDDADLNEKLNYFNIAVKSLESYSERFKMILKNLRYLINTTINLSIFTVITIIICLATIPFGNLILKCDFILYTLFSGVIVCIILIFRRLISILKKAINESD